MTAPWTDHARARPARGRAAYRAKVALREPTTLIGVLGIALFAYLIVAPIISMLSDAGRVQFGDEARAQAPYGSWTGYYLHRVFASPVARDLFWQPLANTALIAVGAIGLALLIGTTLAWLVTRTDLWGRRWLSTALIVPYMLPGWTIALAWTTVFKNRTVGGVPGWLETLGWTPPDWLAYGPVPIIAVFGAHYAPFVILLVGQALRRVDSQLEDTARILGARPPRVALSIVVPAVRPAVMSAIVLILAKCLGDFAVAYVLGIPVRYDVLATSLYRSIRSGSPGAAAVLAGAIILIGTITLLVDQLMARQAVRFVTIGSKGALDRRSRLGAWRAPATAGATLVFGLSAVVPVAVLALSTLMRVPGRFRWDNFSLDAWIGTQLSTVALPQGILRTPDFWAATWNTVWIVGSAALVAGVLGQLVGYVVARCPVRPVAAILRQITFLPYLVPGIAFAVAYLSLFAVPRGPIPALYGTGAILVLALIADQMPFASRAGISAMAQLGREPEEAAQVAGARWWTRLARVVAPIQKGAFATGVLMPFISGIKGVSLVVILAVPGTDLLTTYSLRLLDYAYYQAANAVVLMLSGLALGGTLLVQRLTGTRLGDGLSAG